MADVTYRFEDESPKVTYRFEEEAPQAPVAASPSAPSEPTGLKGIARTIAPYARPVLEYGSMLGGAAVGGTAGLVGANPASVAVGGALGAGLGYSGGRHMANALEEYAGLREPPTFKNALMQTGEDVLTGAAGEMTGQIAGPAFNALVKPAGRFAKGLYEQALKIPPSVPGAIRERAVKTGLEGGYGISDKGLKSVRENMDSLNKRIADNIDGMVQTKTIETTTGGGRAPFKPVVEPYSRGGGFNVKTGENSYLSQAGAPIWYRDEADAIKVVETLMKNPRYQEAVKASTPVTVSREVGTIDMNEVVKRVDDLKKFYKQLPPQAAADFIAPLNELQKKYASAGSITPKQAQEMKRTLYALNRKHYGELSSTVAEGNKAVARGLKEELVKQHPELEYLNKQDSDLINLEKYLERAVNRINNREMLTLPDVAYTGVGVFSGHPVLGASYAALNKIIKSPNVQSRLAILLNKANREAKLIPGTKKPVPGIKGRAAAYPVVKNILDRDNADRTILEKDNWTGNNGDL